VAMAAEARQRGHHVSHQTVATVINDLRYSVQDTRKTRDGDTHPDRNAQFVHIDTAAQEHLAAGDQIISVDTKK